MRHKITFETFLFGGYYFESESWIDTARKERTLRGDLSQILTCYFSKKNFERERFSIGRRKISSYRKRKIIISILQGRKIVVEETLSLPRVADYGQFNRRKKEESNGERERDRILVPRLRRGQRIVEQSRGSPRHPLLPSEFSIVPRVVPLAIFARLALSQIRFPLPLSLSLLVLIGYRFSSSSPGLPAERKRSNSAGNRRLHTYSQERESTRVVSSRNSIYSFFLSHCCHLDEIIPGSSD